LSVPEGLGRTRQRRIIHHIGDDAHESPGESRVELVDALSRLA
jgi:hypothetical protein